jgi:hypothetical protein
MRTIKQITLLLSACFVLFTLACKKDKDAAPTVPELTTADVMAASASTATGGGTITSNGGETITASGVCWSTNANPTISDDTTKGTTASGSFTAMLSGLTASTTYYVRAYAINRVGTGYGEAKQFVTGNAAPVATTVTISGTPTVDEVLTGNYTYSDAEGDAESGTTFQWYVADDGAGTGEAAIDGATEKTFAVQDAQQGKFIRFGVTPKSTTGNQNGVEVKSAFTTAVGEATTVTFTYNGAEVTYGIIVGPSGKKWLDRNLGASRLPQSVDDYQAYGDLFQWGRLADGHQLVIRTDGTDAGASGVNGVTTVHSTTDVPASSAFITALAGNYDWRVTPNNNLWQGVDGINNPCPEGWRIATVAEWTAEGITDINDGFTKLKLTYTGYRDVSDPSGAFALTDIFGLYWSTTITNSYPNQLLFDAGSFSVIETDRGNGMACRCIRD